MYLAGREILLQLRRLPLRWAHCMTVKSPARRSLIHNLQQAVLFPVTSQRFNRNISLWVSRPWAPEDPTGKSPSIYKLDFQRSEMVPLNGWQWKKHILCELLGRRYLSIALIQLHTTYNPSWVTVSPAIYYVKRMRACDFICSLRTYTGCVHPQAVSGPKQSSTTSGVEAVLLLLPVFITAL